MIRSVLVSTSLLNVTSVLRVDGLPVELFLDTRGSLME
jgi:hypothetical protein